MLCFVLLVFLLCVTFSINNTSILTIFSITNLDDHSTQSTNGGHWLAIQEINANPKLLSNYQLTLRTFDAHSDRQQALVHALNITKHENSANQTYFPIILGPPWSSLSTAISPLLSAFHMGQISASATSIVLSETSKYPYFYRTVPSDALQAAGIILLCDAFNWSTIAVVYVNDAWGLYLSLGIQQLSKQYDIDVTAIAVSEHDEITYDYAAKQIKDLRIFITVIIVHDTAIGKVVNIFDAQGIIGYPYFYIGTDGWFDMSTISEYNLTNISAGSIGTVPWNSDTLPLYQYTDDIAVIVNKSQHLHSEFLAKWKHFYHNGYADKLYLETPSLYTIYGYDALYTLAHLMQYIEDDPAQFDGYNLWQMIRNKDSSEIIQVLDHIIKTEIDFLGLSGRVLFDESGDRVNGFFSFSNIHRGNMNSVGYFFKNIDGNISYKLNVSKIIWPQEFVMRGITPQATAITYVELIGIPSTASIVTFVISCVSMTYALVCIFLSVHYQDHKIIKAASWRLNIILCIGAILIYIRTLIYSIDEVMLNNNDDPQRILDIVCNIRIWLSTIAFTLLFMPLFAKTYRLSQIFNRILTEKEIGDDKLCRLVAGCVVIDMILLIILCLISPLKRVYLSGTVESIDGIREVQYIYGSCTFGEIYFSEKFWYFYGLITLWKICQSLWGIHVTLNVSRVRGPMLKQLMTFDETGSQLFSVMFTFTVIAIAIPVWVFGILTERILIYYGVFVCAIFLIGNVVVSVNLLPRLIAVMSGNQDKFHKSPAEELEREITKQLHRLGIKHEWWNLVQSARLSMTSTMTTNNISSSVGINGTKHRRRNCNRFASVGGTTKTGEEFNPLHSVHDIAEVTDDDDDDDDDDPKPIKSQANKPNASPIDFEEDVKNNELHEE